MVKKPSKHEVLLTRLNAIALLISAGSASAQENLLKNIQPLSQRMFEKYRQSSVGAWHSAQKFPGSPKNGRPNAALLHPDVTPKTFQTSSQSIESLLKLCSEEMTRLFWFR